MTVELKAKSRPLFDPPIVRRAALDAILKLNPRIQVRNPVMFIVEIGSALTTVLFIQALLGQGEAPAGFIFGVTVWLWFTVIFANFAEAMAEGRGKAQADSLRKARRDVTAKKLASPQRNAKFAEVSAGTLRMNDVVLVEAGDTIPGDGEVIEGIASVDESAITGESAPVIRESGGDRSSVTGGTRVLSDWLMVRISTNPGEAFLDRMIAMVEGAKRQKTPNEIALDILRWAGEELALTTVTVLRKLGIAGEETTVATVGGVFVAGELVLAPLRARLLDGAPRARLGPPAHIPEIGAIRLALAEGAR